MIKVSAEQSAWFDKGFEAGAKEAKEKLLKRLMKDGYLSHTMVKEYGSMTIKQKNSP